MAGIGLVAVLSMPLPDPGRSGRRPPLRVAITDTVRHFLGTDKPPKPKKRSLREILADAQFVLIAQGSPDVSGVDRPSILTLEEHRQKKYLYLLKQCRQFQALPPRGRGDYTIVVTVEVYSFYELRYDSATGELSTRARTERCLVPDAFKKMMAEKARHPKPVVRTRTWHGPYGLTVSTSIGPAKQTSLPKNKSRP